MGTLKYFLVLVMLSMSKCSIEGSSAFDDTEHEDVYDDVYDVIEGEWNTTQSTANISTPQTMIDDILPTTTEHNTTPTYKIFYIPLFYLFHEMYNY